jgi:hypothetical protein
VQVCDVDVDAGAVEEEVKRYTIFNRLLPEEKPFLDEEMHHRMHICVYGS